MKRIAIYVIYDRQSIIHEYIEHVLREIKKHVHYLVVVCNFRHIESGAEFLQNHADRLIYREITLKKKLWPDIYHVNLMKYQPKLILPRTIRQ